MSSGRGRSPCDTGPRELRLDVICPGTLAAASRRNDGSGLRSHPTQHRGWFEPDRRPSACRRDFSSAPRSHLLNTVVVRTRPQTERATDSAFWSWRTAADGVSERAGPRCFGGAQTSARSAVEQYTGHYAARAGRTSPSPGRASLRTVFPDEGAPAIRRLGGHRVVLSGGTGTSGTALVIFVLGGVTAGIGSFSSDPHA